MAMIKAIISHQVNSNCFLLNYSNSYINTLA